MDTIATLEFAKRSTRYTSEKPYTINYTVAGWEGAVPRSNYEGHKVHDIPILDIRARKSSFSFDSHGFAIVPFETSLQYEDFANREFITEVYGPELAACLLDYFGAAKVHVLDVEVVFAAFSLLTIAEPANRSGVDMPNSQMSRCRRLRPYNRQREYTLVSPLHKTVGMHCSHQSDLSSREATETLKQIESGTSLCRRHIFVK